MTAASSPTCAASGHPRPAPSARAGAGLGHDVVRIAERQFAKVLEAALRDGVPRHTPAVESIRHTCASTPPPIMSYQGLVLTLCYRRRHDRVNIVYDLRIRLYCLPQATGRTTHRTPLRGDLRVDSIDLSSYRVTDAFLGAPFIDVDDWRDEPVPHRYVHGGFEGTSTRFAFCYPPAEGYQGRLFQP